jgi:hypothetical protein
MELGYSPLVGGGLKLTVLPETVIVIEFSGPEIMYLSMNSALEAVDSEGFGREFESFGCYCFSLMAEGKARILIVGGTGYIGRRFVRASLALGHPTYVLSRPEAIGLDIEKLQMLLSFKNEAYIFYR